MTMTAVQDFLLKVSEEQSWQEELAIAMNTEDDREAVTALAQSKGFDFTTDELAQEIQNRQASALARQEAGELSDEELEAVAGGEFVVGSVIITIATAGILSLGASIAVQKIKW
jgi:predicted ribosomally synthesized peptide with nif11-like leader